MATQLPLAPKTTEQEDITLAGQRRINLIWEYTQAFIAGLISIAMVASALMKISDLTITNSFFLVVGFYFSRTNHAAIGGIGSKPNEKYEGR